MPASVRVVSRAAIPGKAAMAPTSPKAPLANAALCDQASLRIDRVPRAATAPSTASAVSDHRPTASI